MAIAENSQAATYSDTNGSLFMPRDSNGSIIEPSVVTLSTDIPSIGTENSAYKTNIKTLGYQRYTLKVEYAPMSKKDAHMLLSMYERFKGAGKWFYFPVNTVTIDTIASIQNRNGRTMLNMPVFETYDLDTDSVTTGAAGQDVFTMMNALVPRFPSNLLVKFTNHDKLYKTTAPAIREPDGRVAFQIYPPLEQSIDEAAIVAREEWDDYEGAHIKMKMRIDDDSFEYGTNGSGLVVIKFSMIEEQ